MNDRIFSPNRNNVFSAMQHNMESSVKVNMRILRRCLENPYLLLTFSVCHNKHHTSFSVSLLRTDEIWLPISFDMLHVPLCCSPRATKFFAVFMCDSFLLVITLTWMNSIPMNLVIIEQIAYVNADNS